MLNKLTEFKETLFVRIKCCLAVSSDLKVSITSLSCNLLHLTPWRLYSKQFIFQQLTEKSVSLVNALIVTVINKSCILKISSNRKLNWFKAKKYKKALP